VSQTKSSLTRTKAGRSSKVTKGSRTVTYGVLSHALEGLGYEKVPAQGSHVVFVHPNSKAHLFLPWRLPSQKVDITRLTGVFELVESAGVASREAVRSALEHSSTGGTRPQAVKSAKRKRRNADNGPTRVGHSRNGRIRSKGTTSPGKARHAPRDKGH
jgi:predicted RNA binding protein YcfA (HicA-like mRNA interferase family)